MKTPSLVPLRVSIWTFLKLNFGVHFIRVKHLFVRIMTARDSGDAVTIYKLGNHRQWHVHFRRKVLELIELR